MNRISLEFLSTHGMVWLCLAPALIAAAIWFYYRTLAPLDPPKRNLLRVLRALAFLIVLFALAEPVLTLVLPESGKPGLAVLVDGSASMALPASNPAIPSRGAEGAGLAAQIDERMKHSFRLDWFRFGAALRGSDGPLPAFSEGNTAIGDCLTALGARQGSRPVSGVILITDGVNTSGADPIGAAREAGVPVFPVHLGSATSPTDARVLQVRANPVAFAGEPTSLEMVLASSGMAARTAELRIEDQGRLLGTRTIAFSGGEDVEQSIRMDVRPVTPGLRRWEVRLVGLTDAVAANDARSVAVRVMERKNRILVVEGRLDWDFTFLRRALEPDSTFGYRFLLADRDGRWLPPRAGVPATGPGDLRDYAAIVLGEVPAGALGGGFYADLARYVEQGGGVLVLGGQHGLMRLRGTPLESKLPAIIRPGTPEDQPTPVRLEAAGLNHPVTALEDSPARAEVVWAGLPPVWPSPDRLTPQPGSSVLLSATRRGSVEPILIAGFTGQGKVVLLDAHGFWRWEFLAHSSAQPSADAFREFAMRTVRWLAEPTLRDRFVAEPVRGVFENGEQPEFTARVWDEGYAPILDARVRIRIMPADSGRADAAPREFELRPSAADGTYAGQTEAFPPGAYRYVAEARKGDGDSTIGRSESLFWVDENGPEAVRLRPDIAVCEQIAQASGGQSAGPEGLDDLLARLPGALRRVGRVREIELWNHIALFVSFVALLGLEWWLRRRSGLA